MKAGIITLSDLSPKTGNYRSWLSAGRATGFCYNCRNYEHCESRVPNPELELMQTELDSLNAKAAEQRERMKAAGIRRQW